MHKRPRRPSAGLLTAAQVARERNVDPRTVRRWVRAGLRVASNGKAGHAPPRFDPVNVARWCKRTTENAQALTRALILKLDSQSRAAARTLANLEKNYLPIEDVNAESRKLARLVHDRLMRLARELPLDLVPAYERRVLPEVERILDEHVRRALTDLASGEETEPAAPARQEIRVQASHTVSEARAQLAILQAAVLDFRGRIAPPGKYVFTRGQYVKAEESATA